MTNIKATGLSCIEVEPTTPAKHSIIWLHGLGADGSDFVPIIPELHLPPTLAIRFIFPHAITRPVTINNGYEMRAWFDIVGLSSNSKVDREGIEESVHELGMLIAKEVERGIPTENIIIAGFSQGAVIALATGLRYPQKLGGILALSGFLPLASEILKQASPANRDIPIFIAHGTEDTIVAYSYGKATYMALQQAGYPVSWHSYPMQHSVCGPEVEAISEWIQTLWR